MGRAYPAAAAGARYWRYLGTVIRMKSEFLRFMTFAMVVLAAALGVFQPFDIDHQEWMDFKWTFVVPLAALGAAILLALWWRQRK